MKIVSLFFLTFITLFAQEYNTIKSKFDQTITSPEGSVLSYKGELFAKKTNLALWVYESPIKKSIYFLNDTILVIEPELEQVIISKIPQIPNIQSILQKAKKQKDGTFHSNYQDIKFSITFEKDLPRLISYKDKLDNQVSIKLINPHINIKLDDKIFSYKIPEDYDILRN